MTADEIRNLMMVSSGRKSADLVLRDVNRVNVHGPKVEVGVDLAVSQGRIAAVGPKLDALIGEATEVVQADGLYALPGFVDAHTHLDSLYPVREFAGLALLSGNTTVITEMAMIANAAGAAGVRAFMEEASGLPLRVFFTAPPLVPPFPELETSAGLNFDDFSEILRRPEVVGVGETYWPSALDLTPGILERWALAQELGKTIEGHAAGARGANLMAYRAGGASSCHESTSADEALERLAMGMAVQIREGYIRQELPAMALLAQQKDLDTRKLMLVTDTASPEMLLRTGVMNELVRRAMAVGFDPLKAIQMVTLNPADYFGLKDLGHLGPGAKADVVLVDRLATLNPRLVFVGGRLAARDGLLIEPIPRHSYPDEVRKTIRIEGLDRSDLALPAPEGLVKIRVVAVAGETITKEEIVETRSLGGQIPPDPQNDLAKIAMFDRHSARPKGSVALARGLGIRRGAVATSMLWDTNNVFVAGADEREMVLAVRRLKEIQGGMVVVQGETVTAEMPMPVAGIISDKSLAEVVRDMDGVERAVRDLGSELSRPFLVFQTFCFTGLPFLRLTDKGLVDVRKRQLVPVVV